MPKKLMMLKIALTILLLLICFTGIANCNNVQHGIEFTLAPLRLSQQDLILMLQKVHSLVGAANKNSDNKYVQETLSISGAGIRINQEGEPQFIGSLSSMDVANDVDYSYRSSGAAINSVSMQLHPSYRKVIIEGKSQEQVEALASYIRQSFDRHTVWFGGIIANILVPIAIGLLIYIILFSLLKKSEKNYGVPVHSAAFQGMAIICGLVIFILEMIFVMIDLFPGVAIYKVDASLIVRQAPLISFIGLLVGIIALVISLRPSKPHR